MYVQGDQLNMAIFFCYVVKSDLSMVYSTVYTRTLDKSLITRYKKHTDMYNWSPCI